MNLILTDKQSIEDLARPFIEAVEAVSEPKSMLADLKTSTVKDLTVLIKNYFIDEVITFDELTKVLDKNNLDIRSYDSYDQSLGKVCHVSEITKGFKLADGLGSMTIHYCETKHEYRHILSKVNEMYSEYDTDDWIINKLRDSLKGALLVTKSDSFGKLELDEDDLAHIGAITSYYSEIQKLLWAI